LAAAGKNPSDCVHFTRGLGEGLGAIRGVSAYVASIITVVTASRERRNDRGREYDAATRTAALMELALAGGSATQAARRLRERGTPVAKGTLQRWKESEQYAQIRDEQALEVQKAIVNRSGNVGGLIA